ncbi:hypothetical protein AB1Y20_021763 [Prymnesium parvum]|uniref:Uncharacterized protein n=1 Tax=Prymnesium parvum TaxID=97485 RepID=A0AB34JN52_PRYPA
MLRPSRTHRPALTALTLRPVCEMCSAKDNPDGCAINDETVCHYTCCRKCTPESAAASPSPTRQARRPAPSQPLLATPPALPSSPSWPPTFPVVPRPTLPVAPPPVPLAITQLHSTSGSWSACNGQPCNAAGGELIWSIGVGLIMAGLVTGLVGFFVYLRTVVQMGWPSNSWHAGLRNALTIQRPHRHRRLDCTVEHECTLALDEVAVLRVSPDKDPSCSQQSGGSQTSAQNTLYPEAIPGSAAQEVDSAEKGTHDENRTDGHSEESGIPPVAASASDLEVTQLLALAQSWQQRVAKEIAADAPLSQEHSLDPFDSPLHDAAGSGRYK